MMESRFNFSRRTIVIIAFILIMFLLFGRGLFIPSGNIVEKDLAYGNSTLSKSGGLLLCMQKATELLETKSNEEDSILDIKTDGNTSNNDDIYNDVIKTEVFDNDIKKYISFSLKNGYKLENLGTSYQMIESFYNSINYKVKKIVRYKKNTLVEELKKGRPVIVLCGNGNFTTTGKYILIYNVTPNETVSVYDSSSKEISEMKFSVDYIINNSSMALEDEIAYWSIYKE